MRITIGKVCQRLVSIYSRDATDGIAGLCDELSSRYATLTTNTGSLAPSPPLPHVDSDCACATLPVDLPPPSPGSCRLGPPAGPLPAPHLIQPVRPA